MAKTTTIATLMRSGVLAMGDGYRTKRSEHGRPGFRIIRVADVREGRVFLDGDDFVSDAYKSQIGAKIATAGDVLLTTKGTVGRVAVMPEVAEAAVYSPQLCYFRVLDRDVLEPAFVRYWLGSREFLAQASHLQGNTDMAPYISLADLRAASITLTSIDEQRAIAEVLGALDDKIAVNDRLAATAHELATALFRQLETTTTERGTLRDLAALEYGKALPASKRVAGAVPVYGSGGISGTHDTALVSGPGVVLGRKGSVGMTYWSHVDFFPIDTTFYAVPRPGVPMEYVYFLLRSMKYGEQNSDSAVPGLNRNDAYSAQVTIPEHARLQAFQAVASNLLAVYTHAAEENRALAATRDALLPQLMSGRLRVLEAAEMAGL
jgi:type I restriction enzyme, S subunit